MKDTPNTSTLDVIHEEVNVYICYGSMTGNAEAIAKDLRYDLLEEYGKHIDCHPLNEYSTTFENWRNGNNVVLVICSTTGNGEHPENACRFWRKIKRREIKKDTLMGVKFAVLALGDTNYDKFCHAGKQINERFLSLSATPLLQLQCVDEVGGLEEPVEKWIGEIKEVLTKLMVGDSEEE